MKLHHALSPEDERTLRRWIAAELEKDASDSGRRPEGEDPKGLSDEVMPERPPEEAASPGTDHD